MNGPDAVPVPRAGPTALPWQHQLPAYSPLSAAALRVGARAALGMIPDPRPDLRDHLKAWYQADEAVLTGSGTQALQLALSIPPSDGVPGPVALPAYGCYDLATAAVGAGRHIALYDIDPDTLGPDFDSLRQAFDRGARTAVIASLYGVPTDWDSASDSAAGTGAMLVEDAAQGIGASWRGRPLGTLGASSVLSFGRGKGWTGGAGGALLLRGSSAGPALAALRGRSAEAATWSSTVAQWALGRPGTYGLPAALPFLHLGETRYHDPAAPRPISRAAAAMVRATRAPAFEEAAARKGRALRLLSLVDDRAGVRAVRPPANGASGWLRLPVRVDGWGVRVASGPIARRLGIAAGYPAPLSELPAVQRWLAGPWRGRRWPGAESLVRDLITLPTHSRVSAADEAAIVRLLLNDRS